MGYEALSSQRVTRERPTGQYYESMSDPWATHGPLLLQTYQTHGRPIVDPSLLGMPLRGRLVSALWATRTFNPCAIHGRLIVQHYSTKPWVVHGRHIGNQWLTDR